MISRSFLIGLTTTGVLLSTPAIVQPALAQRVVSVTPASNSTNVSPTTSIAGQFDSTGNGTVDVNTVRIILNGQDITSQSTVTPNFFTYRPTQPLTAGVNQVRVEYRNTNGEFRSIGWSFTVQQPQPIQISSVTTNAGQTPLTTGATLNITFNGTPGGQASVLLIQDGRTIRELPATEASAGVYRATYTVQASDRVNEGIILARLRRQTQTTFAAAAQGVAFNVTSTTPGNPSTPDNPSTPSPVTELQPRFTNYQDGGRVGRTGFTLIGQTRPNATVQIRVVAGATVFGVPIGGDTVVEQQVTANSSGRFQINVPAPEVAVPGLRYRVRATATEGNQTSPTTEITLRQ